MSDNYNIFKELQLEKKELFHSAMIVAIVSHDEKSRESFFNMLKNKAFKDSINCLINDDSINFDDNNHHWIDTEVNLEEIIFEQDPNTKEKIEIVRKRGKADIWIGTNKNDAKNKYRLIIENKIDARFQPKQLRNYYRYLIGNSRNYKREFGGLFLLCKDEETIKKKHPEYAAKEYDTERKKGKQTQYAMITYKEDISRWLLNVLQNTEVGNFKTAVEAYYDIVRNLVKG